MCHMSHVTFHVSSVTCYMYFYLLFYKRKEKKIVLQTKLDKGVELVGGGSVIKGGLPEIEEKLLFLFNNQFLTKLHHASVNM